MSAKRPSASAHWHGMAALALLLVAAFASDHVSAQDDGGGADDRAALVALYNATGGDDWNRNDNWLTDRPLSEWNGVETDTQGRVTGLALLQNNLRGPLPDEIGKLKKLRDLVLVFNELSGELPASLGDLTDLVFLDLQGNALSGGIPPELGKMAKLVRMILATNQLTGVIPGELADLPELQLLTLNNNDLTGPIPSELGNAPAIEILSLGGNSLSGSIPPSLSDLDLAYLDLDFNSDLVGALPAGLDKLAAMEHLSIHGTSVCVPTDADYRRWLDHLPRFHSSGIDCGVEPDASPVIDVAVFFTPAAREAAGGMAEIEAAVDLMVAETNQAYADSGAAQRIALATVEEVRYRESHNSILDLFRMNDPSDGYLDGLHVVRDLAGADIVQLIVGKGTVCGVANSVPRADLAFGITILDCGGLTFAHEVGHSMGLVHDRYVECRGSPSCTLADHYPYSFGYVNPRGLEAGGPASSRWITIMAYPDRCADAGVSCPQLARFSNPLQFRGGDPLGQTGDRDAASVDGPADAVRALNNARHSVADFRDAVRFFDDDSPRARGTLPDMVLELGDPPLVIDAAKAFQDPNGDRLTFAAMSSGLGANRNLVADAKASGSNVTIRPVASGLTVITITATDTEGSNTAAWQQFNLTVDERGAVDYDVDADGLIEIRNLAQFDAIRYDLNGSGTPVDPTRYAAAFPDARLSMGCDGSCRGYELATDLDFDTNGNGRADAGDDYWDGGRGWRPIGRPLPGFDAIFDGNGHTIANLFIDRDDDAALFGRIGRNGVVRRVGLSDVDVNGGSSAGGLVVANSGVIYATYVTGRVAGKWAGGLAFSSHGGRVSASYGAAQIESDHGGGLVSWNGGWIGASYATGRVTGSGGGLVAVNDSSIVGTYATGRVSPDGAGLVYRGEGDVAHSYWDADTSGLASSAGGTGRSTASLQAPTGYTGIYARWNLDIDRDGRADDPWDFGTTTEYPVLVVDFDGDGKASWEEFGDQRGPIPRVDAVTVVDDWLILTFSKDLEQASIPSPTDFTVRVDGVVVRVDAVEVEGREVRVRLANAPSGEQQVTVSYTPGANPIRGVAGPLAPAIDRRPATVKSEAPRSFWRGWRLILLGEDGD